MSESKKRKLELENPAKKARNEDEANPRPMKVKAIKKSTIKAQVRNYIYYERLLELKWKWALVFCCLKLKEHEKALKELAQLAPLLMSMAEKATPDQQATDSNEGSDPTATDPFDVSELCDSNNERGNLPFLCFCAISIFGSNN